MRVFWVRTEDKKRQELFDYALRMRVHLSENVNFLVAVDDDEILSGFAALLVEGSAVDIRFLYVMEGKRRKQAARLMLNEIEREAMASGIFAVRCIMPPEEGLTALFGKEGYELFPGGSEIALTFGSLFYSELFRRRIYGKLPKKAKALGAATAAEKEILKDYFKQTDSLARPEDYDEDVSAFVLEGSAVKALLMCDMLPKGVIVQYMSFDRERPEYLLDCFRSLYMMVLSIFHGRIEDLMLSFATGSEVDDLLMQRFSGDIVPTEIFTREYVAVKELKETEPE